MHKILFLCLLSLLVILNQQYINGNGGVNSLNKVIKKINSQIIINNKILRKNSILKIKIAGLKGSHESLEARARYELNLIKQNEILIVINNNIDSN